MNGSSNQVLVLPSNTQTLAFSSRRPVTKMCPVAGLTARVSRLYSGLVFRAAMTGFDGEPTLVTSTTLKIEAVPEAT